MNPFIESNSIIDDGIALKERANRDGYLFFRDVINRDSISEVRRDITEILQRFSWIQEGTDPLEAITTHTAVLEYTDEFEPVYY